MSVDNVPTESTVKVVPLENTKAFKPIKIGNVELSHRIAFPPTTRYRANDDHTPSDLNLQYYDDRSKVPGTLLISEGTHLSPFTGVSRNVPGIWNDKHVRAWKKITDKVHENKSFIAIQFWPLGRVADPLYTKELGVDLVSPSAVYWSDKHKQDIELSKVTYREFTTEEIEQVKQDFLHGAKNAIKAGFDFVELHDAHGYLLDTFLQPTFNHRTDKYGGSIENRARLLLELVDLLSEEIGAEKLAVRLSPWAKFNGMKGADTDIHPYVTFGYVLKEFQKRADAGRELAYVSIVEPRVNGNVDAEPNTNSNQFALDIWKGKLFRAGNYSYDAPLLQTLLRDIDDDRTVAGFSRYFISNPDLPNRLKLGLNLVPYHRPVFYNNSENWGYNTYLPYGVTKEFSIETERHTFPQQIVN